MKKELKEKIVKEAQKWEEGDAIRVLNDAKVSASPDAYWVQAWIKVSLNAVKAE